MSGRRIVSLNVLLPLTTLTCMCANTIANRYTLLAPIEGGNVAHVYRAADRQRNQLVALKVLREEGAHDRVKRVQLVQEARAGAMIEHPRVVPVCDLGSDRGHLFLVMPWIEGQTLQARLLEQSVLEVATALPIIQDVLAGLGAMHRLGWVHADIKPDNILLDAAGHATIIDLGCAWRGGESDPTAAEFVVGSPAFMPPEQIRGEDLCPATDLYAVGIMLYRMLTGRLPFQASTRERMLAQQLHAPVSAPRSINGSISPVLEAALLRALQKHPDERFMCAEEMAQALEAATAAAALPSARSETDHSSHRLPRLVDAAKRLNTRATSHRRQARTEAVAPPRALPVLHPHVVSGSR